MMEMEGVIDSLLWKKLSTPSTSPSSTCSTTTQVPHSRFKSLSSCTPDAPSTFNASGVNNQPLETLPLKAVPLNANTTSFSSSPSLQTSIPSPQTSTPSPTLTTRSRFKPIPTASTTTVPILLAPTISTSSTNHVSPVPLRSRFKSITSSSPSLSPSSSTSATSFSTPEDSTPSLTSIPEASIPSSISTSESSTTETTISRFRHPTKSTETPAHLPLTSLPLPTIRLKTTNPPTFFKPPSRPKFMPCSTPSTVPPSLMPPVSLPPPPEPSAFTPCGNLFITVSQPVTKPLPQPIFPLLPSPQLIPEPVVQKDNTSPSNTSPVSPLTSTPPPSLPNESQTPSSSTSSPPPSTPKSTSVSSRSKRKFKSVDSSITTTSTTSSPITQPTIMVNSIALPLHSISPLISPSPGRLTIDPESLTKPYQPVILNINNSPPPAQQNAPAKAPEDEQDLAEQQPTDDIDTNIYLNMDFVPAEPLPTDLASPIAQTPPSQVESVLEADPIHISPQPLSRLRARASSPNSEIPQLSPPISLSSSLEGFSTINSPRLPSTTPSKDIQTTPTSTTTTTTTTTTNTNTNSTKSISDLYTLDVFEFLEDCDSPITPSAPSIFPARRLPKRATNSPQTIQDKDPPAKLTAVEQLRSILAAAEAMQPVSAASNTKSTNSDASNPKKATKAVTPTPEVPGPISLESTADVAPNTATTKPQKKGVRLEYFSHVPGKPNPTVAKSGDDDWDLLRSDSVLADSILAAIFFVLKLFDK